MVVAIAAEAAAGSGCATAYEYNLFIIPVAGAIILAGPGAFALDRVLGVLP